MTGVPSNDFSMPRAVHSRLVFLSDEVRSTPTEPTAERRRLCASSPMLRSAASMRDRDFDVRALAPRRNQAISRRTRLLNDS